MWLFSINRRGEESQFTCLILHAQTHGSEVHEWSECRVHMWRPQFQYLMFEIHPHTGACKNRCTKISARLLNVRKVQCLRDNDHNWGKNFGVAIVPINLIGWLLRHDDIDKVVNPVFSLNWGTLYFWLNKNMSSKFCGKYCFCCQFSFFMLQVSEYPKF